ncbi:unnamed protein product, partial [Medioppia subpectinata]
IVTELTDQSFVEYLTADSGHRLTADETKALIGRKCGHNSGDDGICVLEDSIQVSLICPVSQRRLRIPCRAVTCQHIECFDGQSLFAVNEWRSEWLCPICQSPADTSDIRVDTYFETVLTETPESVTTIRVKSDGNYVIGGRFDGQSLTTNPTDNTIGSSLRAQWRPMASGSNSTDSHTAANEQPVTDTIAPTPATTITAAADKCEPLPSGKRSSASVHSNGDDGGPQHKRPHTMDHSPPTVPINVCQPPIASPSDMNLSDNSSQEVVTDCAFRRLPKYTIVRQLYGPRVLTSISDAVIWKSFTLYEDYFPDTYFLADKNLSKILIKNRMQIQLRFSRTAEPAAKDSVPEGLCIDVNDTRVYTHSSDGQQWCRPYDVSQYCRLGLNDIQFSLSSKNNGYFLPTLFEVSIVKELTDQSFVEYLTADSGHRLTADDTKALIRRKFGHNSGDDGISLLDDWIQVSLKCPLSQRRLRIPCRTVTCQHIECFDGQSFFAANEWRSEWLCPICHASADTSALRVDTYFQNVLVKTPEFMTTIRVTSDGNYVIGGRFDGQVIQLLDDSETDEEVMASSLDKRAATLSAEGCQRLRLKRLHRLITRFTKSELIEVLKEFQWTYNKSDIWRTLLSRVQQLIDSPDADVQRLSRVIPSIHKRKAHRKDRRRMANKSANNYGVNGGQPLRPPSAKRQRVILPPIDDRWEISPPTVHNNHDIDSWSLPFPYDTMDTDLSPPADTSDQEVVTAYAFRPLPKYTIVKRLHETEVLPSISDRGVRKTFLLFEKDFVGIYWPADRNLQKILAKNGMQILLRFSHTAEPAAKDSVPEALCIVVNGALVYTYSDDQQWCRPFDVSQYCRLGFNDMWFSLSSKNSEYILPTLFEVSIVKELTDQLFVEYLTADSGHRLTADETKALIGRKFGHNWDDDGFNLLDDSIQVSLMCPLSQRRLRIPCRTVKCQHIECFDGQSFFAANEWRSEWLCPICHASADTSALRVDTYFQNVLAETPKSLTTIRVTNGGLYIIDGRFDGQMIELIDDSLSLKQHLRRTSNPVLDTMASDPGLGKWAAMLRDKSFYMYPNLGTLHQLITRFTKRELKQVLGEFQWTYTGSDIWRPLLSRVQQLIDSSDTDVYHVYRVIQSIHKRKAHRKDRRMAKKSANNDGVNGGQPLRPPSPKRERLISPPIGNRSEISPPNVLFNYAIETPPLVTTDASHTDLSPLADTSDQEVVTAYAFRPFPKYTIVKRLLETEVLPSISDRGVRKTFLLFEYFPADINLVKMLYKNQMGIQLRFSHTAEPAAKDSVPEALCIHVNDALVYTYTDNKQWCRPFNVSRYCRLGRNDIQFSLSTKNSEYVLPTLFEVSIVKVLTAQLFSSLLTIDSKNWLTTNATNVLISRRVGHNAGDDGISLLDDSIRVSLMCPLSQRRLRIPCRTVTCQHIECFDGQSFFAANEWRSEWLCPICQALADTSALRVDTYFQKVLAKTPESVTTIRVKNGGSYVIGGRFDGQVIQLMDDSETDEEVMASSDDNED